MNGQTQEVGLERVEAENIAALPSGLYVGSSYTIRFGENMSGLSWDYSCAVDHWYSGGYGAAVGHFDVVYPLSCVIRKSLPMAGRRTIFRLSFVIALPAESRRIMASRIAGRDNEARQEVHGKYLFFGARLPHDLPDGRYTVAATIVEADGRAAENGPGKVECSYDLPVTKVDTDGDARQLATLSDDAAARAIRRSR